MHPSTLDEDNKPEGRGLHTFGFKNGSDEIGVRLNRGQMELVFPYDGDDCVLPIRNGCFLAKEPRPRRTKPPLPPPGLEVIEIKNTIGSNFQVRTDGVWKYVIDPKDETNWVKIRTEKGFEIVGSGGDQLKIADNGSIKSQIGRF